MPLYDFKCEDCEKVFEVHQSVKRHTSKGKKCPVCGSKKTAQVVSGFRLGAIVGKGDTTSILLNDDGTPYRLTESTVKDQKKEIARKLMQKEEAKIANGEIDPNHRLNYEVL